MMIRTMLTLAGVVAVLGAASPAVAGGCKGCTLVAKKGDGFCCGKGKIYGVELTSKKLYNALAGREMATDKIRCPGCQAAAKSSGACSHCKVAMADGKMYRSMMSHALAKGTPISEDKMGCGGCKTAHKAGGFCDGCGMGFVASRMFKDKAVYEVASKAYKTLTIAAKAATKCVGCAVAMVTDGKCDPCNVSFKDGKKSG